MQETQIEQQSANPEAIFPIAWRSSTFWLGSARTSLLLLAIVLSGHASILGQLPSGSALSASGGPEKQEKRFVLEIEVLTQPQSNYRINAQKWGAVLQELGYSVRFRDGRPGEKLRIEDVERTGDRVTHVVGLMERDGQISFRNQKYNMGSPEALQQLFEQLQLYGAAGPPAANPTWGLTDEQFKSVTRLLSSKVDGEIQFRTPVEAIDSLKLPAVFRLKFTDAARERSFAVRSSGMPQAESLNELTQGSALAIILAQYGLGFRPLLNPDGGYVLEIDAGGEADNMWPVGWKSKEALITLLPGLYKSIPVDVEDVELSALIDVIAEKVQVSPFYASSALIEAGISVENILYTRKPDKLSPARLMQIIGDKYNMGLDIRFDENGKAFLWVTTREDYLAFRTRFAHIISGK